ncbi:MAG TPA: hypothetical protein VFH56_02670 [Acidimicrobiales bacterium]|nr:hypothetical protein [Acidimicrobiales bacterium]
MNQFIVDRIQSGGAGNLNIPQERVYELGNYQSVGIVRDVPDLSFSLDVLDVGTQVEALLCGSSNPANDVLGDGVNTAGASYDLSAVSPIDIISPFKSAQGAYNVVKGVAVPQLSLESASYKYGLKQNAGETFSLRGDSIYYVPGIPFLVTYTGDGTTTSFNFSTLSGGTQTDEVQSVTISGAPTGGTFTLTFNGQTTAGIAYNAAASAVQSALVALGNIGTGNVAVTGSAGGPYTVTFQGTLAGTDVAQLTANSAGLTGGTTPTVTVATTTQGSTTPKDLTALEYIESGSTFYALNVSVDGVRQNKDTDYTDSSTSVVFTTAPATGAKIHIVFGSNKDSSNAAIEVDYTQAVNADLSVKPAAIRGRDIKVYLGGFGSAYLWHDVQSVDVDWKVTLDADYEFGNAHAVARDYIDAPDVTGTIEIKSITMDALFTKLALITGVPATEVIGPQSSVTVPIIVQLLNPDSGGTSAVPRGTVLKTLFVPDARFVIPGYEGRVSQKVMSQLQFTSDKGLFTVVKGAATAAQLGL